MTEYIMVDVIKDEDAQDWENYVPEVREILIEAAGNKHRLTYIKNLDVQEGDLVKVPYGKREKVGIVLTEADPDSISPDITYKGMVSKF